MSNKRGIKIGRPGLDVLTAADKDLVWSSEFNTPKVAKILHFTSTTPQAHGLGYVPAFIFMTHTDIVDAFDTEGWTLNNQGYTAGYVTTVSVDNSYVYCDYLGTEIYVILFIDSLDE